MVSNIKKIMLISWLFSLFATFNNCLAVDQREYLQQILPVSQRHILHTFYDLNEIEKKNLLASIEKVNWEKLNDLLIRVSIEQKDNNSNVEHVSFEPAVPMGYYASENYNKGDGVLRYGGKQGKAQYGFIFVAGGTGTGLRYPHPKGMLPASPLSNKSLYVLLIEKIRQVAWAHGHQKMYPLVIMVSDKTETETIKYIKGLDFWDSIKDRIIFVMQQQLPELIMSQQGAYEVLLRQKDSISLAGAGHGDAFDYVLNAPLQVTGNVWDETQGTFVEKEVVPWLMNLGVKYIQYANIDNPLMPIDKYFIGAHVASRDTQKEEKDHYAHISLILIEKETPEDRLGNVIIIDGNKESVDYGTASDEIKSQCTCGDPSIRLVTLESLQGSIAIEKYGFVKKMDNVNGNEMYVYKFEFSSGDKKRYGVEVLRECNDVFASIKNRDETHTKETPSTSKKIQSDYWKKIIQVAYPELSVPENSVIELPWACDKMCMAPQELRSKLDEINFTKYFSQPGNILVTQKYEVIIS